MSKIAFIGLGAMGSGMAANLVRAGHAVRAFDLSEAALARAEAAGAVRAASAAAAVEAADAVVTMLPAGEHVRAIYAESVIPSALADAILIDCSTIDVDSARAVAALCAERALAFVDAPVSGGTAAAESGSLTFMVGGEASAFARAEPILSAMGKAVIHAGRAGAGQAAKICNNMLLAISMIGTCEAIALARKLGLGDQTFFDIASKASGQCWSLTSYCPAPGPVPGAPSNRGFAPGFQAALMLKDLRLALEAGRSAGQSLPLGSAAGAVYELMATLGQGGRDFSAVIELLEGVLPDPAPKRVT